MSDAEVYLRQQFGQPVRLGRAPALIVVDFVNGFLDPAMFGGGNIAEAAARSEGVIAAFRDQGAPVVYTRIVYAADGSDAGIWCEKVPRLRELTEEAEASQVTDSLAPGPGELVIRKTQASAFFETGLASALRMRGVDTVVIVGATTSGCVRATAIDAISLNFRPVVIADCVGDRAEGPHAANLFDIGQKYANILFASEIARIF
jgi:maleamate amidohydrolase